MVGAFYLLLWRPQQRRMAMVRVQSALQEGDDVLDDESDLSRIYASARRVDAELEIAPGTVIHVAVAQVQTGHSPTSRPEHDVHGEATEAG